MKKVKAQKVKRNRGIAYEIEFRIGRMVLIVMIITAVLTMFTVFQMTSDSREKELTLESEVAVGQITGFFESYIKMSKQLAVNPQIQELLEETTAGESLLDEALYPTVFDDLLKIAQTDTENVLATWIADVDANMVTQSDKFTSGDGWEITERAWYTAIQTGETVLTEPYVDASTGQMILSAVSPVKDDNGNALGVAGMDISMQHIMQIMPQYKVGENGFVMLLTGNGLIIYHPNEEVMQKNIAEIDVSSNVVEAINGEDTEFLRYSAFGDSKYGCVAPASEIGYVVVSCMGSGEFYSQINVVVFMFLVVFLLGIFAIIVAMRRTANQITKPILLLNETAQQLAEGNLQVEINVESKNEIGELARSIGATVSRLKEYINYIDEISAVLDRMAEGKLSIELMYDYVGEFEKVKIALINISHSMKKVMEGIVESSEQVSAGADDLASASQSLAEGAGTQAAAVQELVAATTTVAEGVEESHKDAEGSAVEAGKATSMLEESQRQMNVMMEAMKTIQVTSQQVVGIIATIEEIADQTNLLSLNASIEAARAGEAGRGFAVVAGEIGNLAGESAQAANNTRELIGLSMNEIQKGNAIADTVMESLSASVEAIEKVNGMIHKTADNARDQALNMEQIRMGIEDIANSIQDSSAMAEECSATSEELAAQAVTLNNMVQKFEF